MQKEKVYIISGKEEGVRLSSRILEEKIQAAVAKGRHQIEVRAFGQHGIGGRLRSEDHAKIHVTIMGHSGQRAGSLGYPNTFIEIKGSASDDIGWLNAGAHIVVQGNASNGAANGMAQGKIYVSGNIGSRGMTMTKSNPRFQPPELWVLGSVGDYFGEFMAGGIAVICGFNAQTPDNILGHRPFVGMVGGKTFFRGKHQGYSESDAKIIPISDNDWKWLSENLATFLASINRPELFDELSYRKEWQLLTALAADEKSPRQYKSMKAFRQYVWDKELGKNGIFGGISDDDMSPLPVITRGVHRRFKPVWEHQLYYAPCRSACPTGIPVQDRWRLIREGKIEEAVDMALEYTPFPATVCGYLCPNKCMAACTRSAKQLTPIDITVLGKKSLAAKLPDLPPIDPGDHRKVAIIGGGPAGLSTAWQLLQKGHGVTLFDAEKKLGGKITKLIPESRIPKEVFSQEIERIQSVIPHERFEEPLTPHIIERLKKEYAYIILATGAQRPRLPNLPGKEHLVTYFDFLKKAKENQMQPMQRIVIIGAGNVGCDVATEAHRLGATDITLIDIQAPAAYGKEREEAEKVGAKFKWPCFTKEITPNGVLLDSGEELPADVVVISIGDIPEIEYLPDSVKTENGFVTVNEIYQTSDPKIFAVGDIVTPGLLTDAIGHGKTAAQAIADLFAGQTPVLTKKKMIDKSRVTLEYYDPKKDVSKDLHQCGAECSSCGSCRDCGICVALCPEGAIARIETDGKFEYAVDAEKCIGCGFCADGCPCGVWKIHENPIPE